MRVAHLIGSTGLYGAEKWILALMSAMEETDRTISSVLLNLCDNRGVESELVKCARSKGLEASDFFTGGSFNPLSVFKLKDWLINNNIDIVHGHGYKSDILGFLSAKLAGCRVVSTPHGWSKEPDFKLSIYQMFDRFVFRYMDAVCPLSVELKDGLKAIIDERKLYLILNGVDIKEIEEVLPAADFDADFIIGYVGRLVVGKDLQTLFKAYRSLIDNGCAENGRLILVGEGEFRNYLEEYSETLKISDRVEFLGFRLDAISYLKKFDVFVLPSLSEGVPRCIMEAMAVGVPVVASNIEGNRVLVENGVTGLLFSVGDEVDLAKNIEMLIQKKETAKIMAENAKKLVFSEFSNLRMASEYASLYNRLLLRE